MRRRRAERERVYSELADLHVATLASATPVDVLSTDRHTVKPWFEGKLPFTFNLPELQGIGIHLARRHESLICEQTPGAHLIYQLRKHKISVFIFQDRGADATICASGPCQCLSFTLKAGRRMGCGISWWATLARRTFEALSKLLRDAG